MSKYILTEYTPAWFDKWNKFVKDSNNGTIFHRLDFLEYHGDKFKKYENHLIWLKGDTLFAVMPLAIFDKDGIRIAKSPYGASYGGILTRRVLNYRDSKEITLSLINYLKEIEVGEIYITLPIRIFEKVKSETFFFSFLEQGFKIINSDISSVVELKVGDIENELFSSRARNMARKAVKGNIKTKFNQSIDDFWKVMVITFSKHGTKPTHNFDEWKYLCEKFPAYFWNDIAYIDTKPIAGIGHIKVNEYADSSFYLCNDPEYNETQALTLLIYEALIKSQLDNNLWFDFGTSSINMIARENIFRFKESFGSIGVFRHTLKMEIGK